MVQRISHSKESGFTIIEIGVIVPILIVIALVLFDALFLMLRTSSQDKTNIDITYDNQTALATIEKDAVLTSTFLPAMDTALVDPYRPTSNGNKWSYIGDSVSSTNRVLILRSYNTNSNPEATNRKPSYLSAKGCGTDDIYKNDVLQYNTIYFVQNGTLFRRRVIDTTQSTCESVYQLQSCPVGATNTRCKADDEVIATDVSEFSVGYYAAQTAASPLNVYVTGADPDLVTTATTADIKLTITRKAYGNPISRTATLRVSRINGQVGGE